MLYKVMCRVFCAFLLIIVKSSALMWILSNTSYFPNKWSLHFDGLEIIKFIMTKNKTYILIELSILFQIAYGTVRKIVGKDHVLFFYVSLKFGKI